MKNIVKISGVIILLGVLIVLLVSIKLYNKPHKEVQNSPPDVMITAESLIGAFENNEQEANEKYLDKIIQIEGVVSSINTSNGNSVITLSASDSMGTVVCTMEPSQNKRVLGIENGTTITLKGICTGFIMDVMLVRTVIVD